VNRKCPPGKTILQLSTPYTHLIPSNSHLLNHRRWCHLANKLKTYCEEEPKHRNLHVTKLPMAIPDNRTWYAVRSAFLATAGLLVNSMSHSDTVTIGGDLMKILRGLAHFEDRRSDNQVVEGVACPLPSRLEAWGNSPNNDNLYFTTNVSSKSKRSDN